MVDFALVVMPLKLTVELEINTSAIWIDDWILSVSDIKIKIGFCWLSKERSWNIWNWNLIAIQESSHNWLSKSCVKDITNEV